MIDGCVASRELRADTSVARALVRVESRSRGVDRLPKEALHRLGVDALAVLRPRLATTRDGD